MDLTSKDNLTPRENTSGDEMEEKGAPIGPLDTPQDDSRELRPTLLDMMHARLSIPARHAVPDVETADRESARREMLEATGSTIGNDQAPAKPVSILRKRMRRFKSLKRGYYSFIILMGLYIISFFLPVLVNSKAVVVHYNGDYYFPAFSNLVGTGFYPGKLFGQTGEEAEANYRKLDVEWEQAGGDNWMWMPLYPYDPFESDYEHTGEGGGVMNPPSEHHVFGTDPTGRDVFARMCYGFNVSISFAILLTVTTFTLGIIVGGIMGYYGGKIDLFSQRAIEVWQTVPALFLIIIVSAIVIPNFIMLVGMLFAFGWMGMTYYIRGEFYREKAKDYVAAAISLGAKDHHIIFKHILPNSLTPVIATFPFAIIGGISSLVSLDYLGYGLPPPTPSWGQMVQAGLKEFSGDFQNWWLVLTPLSAMFLTLLLVTFIGESLREAFDPKVFSRLR